MPPERVTGRCRTTGVSGAPTPPPALPQMTKGGFGTRLHAFLGELLGVQPTPCMQQRAAAAAGLFAADGSPEPSPQPAPSAAAAATLEADFVAAHREAAAERGSNTEHGIGPACPSMTADLPGSRCLPIFVDSWSRSELSMGQWGKTVATNFLKILAGGVVCPSDTMNGIARIASEIRTSVNPRREGVDLLASFHDASVTNHCSATLLDEHHPGHAIPKPPATFLTAVHEKMYGKGLIQRAVDNKVGVILSSKPACAVASLHVDVWFDITDFVAEEGLVHTGMRSSAGTVRHLIGKWEGDGAEAPLRLFVLKNATAAQQAMAFQWGPGPALDAAAIEHGIVWVMRMLHNTDAELESAPIRTWAESACATTGSPAQLAARVAAGWVASHTIFFGVTLPACRRGVELSDHCREQCERFLVNSAAASEKGWRKAHWETPVDGGNDVWVEVGSTRAASEKGWRQAHWATPVDGGDPVWVEAGSTRAASEKGWRQAHWATPVDGGASVWVEAGNIRAAIEKGWRQAHWATPVDGGDPVWVEAGNVRAASEKGWREEHWETPVDGGDPVWVEAGNIRAANEKRLDKGWREAHWATRWTAAPPSGQRPGTSGQ